MRSVFKKFKKISKKKRKRLWTIGLYNFYVRFFLPCRFLQLLGSEVPTAVEEGESSNPNKSNNTKAEPVYKVRVKEGEFREAVMPKET